MFGHLRDPDLPALEALGQTDLARITGAAQARLLRARYRPGARAVLHVALGDDQDAGEGAIWFYAGDKTRKLARRTPNARLDAGTGALFQAFPQDHQMPHLATFVADAMSMAQGLIGGAAARPPVLMRYRPGLSATFRWTREDGCVFFVKQTPVNDIAAQALAISHLAAASKGLPVRFAPVAGINAEYGLIAYEAAQGRSLDTLLPTANAQLAKDAMAQVTGALRSLWSLSVVPERMLDRAALLRRAEQARQMIALFYPNTGRCLTDLIARLETRRIPVRLRPIHADMKLEHAFLFGPVTTLIDTESLSLGDPDYDLAKLESRVVMAEVVGLIGREQAESACRKIRQHAGCDYDWFLTCARLQCAKFFAQRFDPATAPLMRRVLATC